MAFFLMYIDFRATPFNVTTALLMALTAWLGYFRFSRKLDSNWPFFYYLLVVAYLKFYEGGLDPYLVYTGVLCALFLRFEFMGGNFIKFVQVVEFIVIGYILWRGAGLIMLW